MKNWKLEISLKVADSWVADGFDCSERIEEIETLLQSMLPYAYGHEIVVNVKIVKKPDQKVIEQLQNGELEIKD